MQPPRTATHESVLPGLKSQHLDDSCLAVRTALVNSIGTALARAVLPTSTTVAGGGGVNAAAGEGGRIRALSLGGLTGVKRPTMEWALQRLTEHFGKGMFLSRFFSHDVILCCTIVAEC